MLSPVVCGILLLLFLVFVFLFYRERRDSYLILNDVSEGRVSSLFSKLSFKDYVGYEV